MRRLILTGSIVPAVLGTVGSVQAQIVWSNPTETLTNDNLYSEGLKEYKGATSNGDINQGFNEGMLNTGATGIGTLGGGIVDRPRFGLTSEKPGETDNNGNDVWSNNQVWRYTGQFFDADGTFTFAENIDDQVRVFIDGVLVLQDNAWDTATRTNNGGPNDGNNYGMGPDNDGWHNIEIRFQNGGGGAGPGATNNNWAQGSSPDFLREGFSLNVNGVNNVDANNYEIPIETVGGGATVWRYQTTAAVANTIIVDGSGTLDNIMTVSLAGNTTVANETSVSFEAFQDPAVTVNLTGGTVGQPRTLNLGTTNYADSFGVGFGNTDVRVNVDANVTFNPGQFLDGGGAATFTKGGVGLMRINSSNPANAPGTTLRLVDGLTSVEAPGGNNPINPLGNIPTVEVNSTTATLRLGGGANFTQNFVFNQSATLEHTANTIDRISGTVTIAPTRNLLTNVSNGVLRITGNVSAGSGHLTKAGGNALVLGGASTLNDLTINAGKVDVTGSLALTNAPTIAAGTSLGLYGSGNAVPATLSVPTGRLEGTPAGLGSTAVNLTGGTLTLSAPLGLTGNYYAGGGNDDNVNNTNAEFFFPAFSTYSSYFAGRGAGTVTAPTTDGNGYGFAFNPDGDGDGPFSAYGFGNGDDIVSRMNGLIRITQAGTYTFTTTSDDGSMVFVNGQTVVNNNFYQGMTPRSGSITLEAGVHNIDIGFYEGGGGAGLIVQIAGPGINGTQLLTNSDVRLSDPLNATQTFNNAINVASSSAIEVAAVGAVANNLTLQPGVTLTKFGGQLSGPLNLNGAGSYTLNVTGNMVATNVLNGGAATNINKTGPGVLILDNTTVPQFTGGGTITVSAGSLGLLLETGGLAPNGGAALGFAGGGVVLSSKGGDQTYPIPAFVGNGSLEARQIGSGVPGPVTVNLTGSLGITAGQTITMGTADGYVMQVGGSATGSGTLRLNGGVVNATTNTALQGLNLVMAPTTSMTATWNAATPSLGSLSGNGSSTLNIGTGAGNSVLTLNTPDTRLFAGALNAVSGNTLDVVMAGTGKQQFDSFTGTPHQVNNYIVNAGGTVEIGGNTAQNSTIRLNGGTLQASGIGLVGDYYNIDPNPNGDYNAFGTFNARFDGYGTPQVRAVTTTGGQTNLDWNNNNGSDQQGPFGNQGFTPADNIQVRYRGQILIPRDGVYGFDTTSDDGSMLFIDGQVVVNNNFFQGMTTRSGTVALTAGYHDISLGFYEGGGGAGVIYRWQPPGEGFQAIPNTAVRQTHETNTPGLLQMVASSTIDPRGGTATFGTLQQSAGTTLATTAGRVNIAQAALAAPGTYGYNVADRLALNSINDGGNAVTLNKAGAGTLILNAPAAPQLTNDSSIINVNAGTLVTVGGGTHNPLGLAGVNLAAGSALGLTSVGGDVSFSPNLNISGSAAITSGRFGVGSAGPLTTSLNNSVSIGAGNTLSVSSVAADNYILNLAGNVTGAGTLAVTGGQVRIGAASPAATTVAAGGTLVLAGSNYTGGTITPNGGFIYAAAGPNNLGTTAIAGTPITGTGQVGALAGQLHVNFTDPAGGFGTPAGLASTLARTPEFAANLRSELQFGPAGAGDLPIANLFGTNTGNTDIFTMTLSGTYTPLASGPHAFKVSLTDDTSFIYVDLDQDGTFEGNELLATQGCCPGDPFAGVGNTVNLVAGQTYKTAILLRDTGGGSSLAARISSPLFAENFLNPGTFTQGIWASGDLAGGASVIIDSNASLRAGSLTNGRSVMFNGNAPTLILESPGATTSDVSTIFTSTATNATIQLGANNTLNLGNLSIGAGTTLIKSGPGVLNTTTQTMGAGSTLRVDAGLVNLNGVSPASAGAVVVNNLATVNLAGSISGSIDINGGGTLVGIGTGGALTANSGGTISPGNTSIGNLTFNGSALFNDGAIFQSTIQSTSTTDTLTINGPSIILGTGTGSTLSLTLGGGFAANPGDLFPLIFNDGFDPVVGTFAQGSSINVGGHVFNIVYDATLGIDGANNDVALSYVVPEPGALALLLGGFGTLVGLRRVRRRA